MSDVKPVQPVRPVKPVSGSYRPKRGVPSMSLPPTKPPEMPLSPKVPQAPAALKSPQPPIPATPQGIQAAVRNKLGAALEESFYDWRCAPMNVSGWEAFEGLDNPRAQGFMLPRNVKTFRLKFSPREKIAEAPPYKVISRPRIDAPFVRRAPRAEILPALVEAGAGTGAGYASMPAMRKMSPHMGVKDLSLGLIPLGVMTQEFQNAAGQKARYERADADLIGSSPHAAMGIRDARQAMKSSREKSAAGFQMPNFLNNFARQAWRWHSNLTPAQRAALYGTAAGGGALLASQFLPKKYRPFGYAASGVAGALGAGLGYTSQIKGLQPKVKKVKELLF